MSQNELNLVAEETARLTAKYQMILKKEFLSIEEAAIYLDKKEQFVRSLVAPSCGRPPIIKSYSLGKFIHVKRTDLDDYIMANPRHTTQSEIISEVSTKTILKQ